MIMKKRVNKSAQAQIITTVLIILLVLAAIVIVWNVINITVKESSEDIGLERFSVSLSTSQVDLAQDPILVPVTRETGAGNLIAIRIIFTNSSGNSGIYENTTKIPNELETITYSISKSDLNPSAEGISLISFEVYPIIAVSGKNITGIMASGGEVIEEGGEETFTPPSGLVSWWKLDDGNGTVALDSQGSNSGTLTYMDNSDWISGQVNGALEFDGVDDYVLTGDGSMPFDGPWSVSLWVDVSTAARGDKIFSLEEAGWAPNFYFKAGNADNVLLYMGASNYRRWLGSWNALAANGWHHVVVSIPGTAQTDISESKLYIDGTEYAVDGTVSSGPQSPYEGYFKLNPGAESSIDEVMIFNRSLSAGEIQTIYDFQK